MDRSVEPCEDFYRFSCGGWIKNNPIPKSRSMWDQFSKLELENDKFVAKIVADKEIRAKYSKVSGCVIEVLPLSQSASKKHNKKAHNPLRTS